MQEKTTKPRIVFLNKLSGYRFQDMNVHVYMHMYVCFKCHLIQMVLELSDLL